MPQEHNNALDSVLLSANGSPDRNWMAVNEMASGTTVVYTVVPPGNPFARVCFDDFDAQIRLHPPGTEIQLRTLWRKFSRSPYGLDIRSFLLLFGVWYATHRDECIILKDKVDTDVSWTDIVEKCERRADMFALVTSPIVSLRLRDLDGEIKVLKGLLGRLQGWQPGDPDTRQLLNDATSARGKAPGAREWAEIEAHIARISQQSEQEAQQSQLAQALNEDIARNCRLENLTDYTRRLSPLAVSAASSAARASVARCFETLLNRAVDAAKGAIGRNYGSGDVERHELERVRDYLNACPFAELAQTIDENLAKRAAQTLAQLSEDLNRALSTVSERHGAKRLAQERTEDLQRRFREIVEGVSSGTASLRAISDARSGLEAIRDEVPSPMIQEFSRSLAQCDRQLENASRTVTSWINFFAEKQSPDGLNQRLDKAQEILRLSEETEFEGSVREIIEARALYSSGGQLYKSALEGLSAGPAAAEAALISLAKLESDLPPRFRISLAHWRSKIEEAIVERRQVAGRRAEAMEAALKKVDSPEAALNALDNINAFIRESGAYAPAAGDGLAHTLATILSQNAPAQIAALLKPIPAADRPSVIEKALALVAPPE
jgi:hypothetical protein